MFAKFNLSDISGVSQVKSSQARGIRTKILEQFPSLEAPLEELMPKRLPLKLAKCKARVTLILGGEGQILFVQERDGPFFPHLRLLHQYPDILPHFRVDKGAIKRVLSGAPIMCPGLTSANAAMVDVPADTPVAIMAEGKQHALAIGLTVMSTEEIRTINKDVGVNNVLYLNDGVWKTSKCE